MKKIHQYFSGVPQVVLLPNLQWDFDLYPDFNEEGFYLNYDHILTAHPPLRDRMLYGLRRLASLINLGVSNEESYFIKCENFENLVESVYNCKFNLFLKFSNNMFQLLLRMLLILTIWTMNGNYPRQLKDLKFLLNHLSFTKLVSMKIFQRKSVQNLILNSMNV